MDFWVCIKAGKKGFNAFGNVGVFHLQVSILRTQRLNRGQVNFFHSMNQMFHLLPFSKNQE